MLMGEGSGRGPDFAARTDRRDYTAGAAWLLNGHAAMRWRRCPHRAVSIGPSRADEGARPTRAAAGGARRDGVDERTGRQDKGRVQGAWHPGERPRSGPRGAVALRPAEQQDVPGRL